MSEIEACPESGVDSIFRGVEIFSSEADSLYRDGRNILSQKVSG